MCPLNILHTSTGLFNLCRVHMSEGTFIAFTKLSSNIPVTFSAWMGDHDP